MLIKTLASKNKFYSRGTLLTASGEMGLNMLIEHAKSSREVQMDRWKYNLW